MEEVKHKVPLRQLMKNIQGIDAIKAHISGDHEEAKKLWEKSGMTDDSLKKLLEDATENIGGMNLSLMADDAVKQQWEDTKKQWEEAGMKLAGDALGLDTDHDDSASAGGPPLSTTETAKGGRQDISLNFCTLLRFTQSDGKILNIAEAIPPGKSQQICTELLNDTMGTKFKAIQSAARDSQEINREILQKWVNETTKEDRTWRRLVQVLKESGCMAIAEEIEEVVGDC